MVERAGETVNNLTQILALLSFSSLRGWLVTLRVLLGQFNVQMSTNWLSWPLEARLRFPNR